MRTVSILIMLAPHFRPAPVLRAVRNHLECETLGGYEAAEEAVDQVQQSYDEIASLNEAEPALLPSSLPPTQNNLEVFLASA